MKSCKAVLAFVLLLSFRLLALAQDDSLRLQIFYEGNNRGVKTTGGEIIYPAELAWASCIRMSNGREYVIAAAEIGRMQGKGILNEKGKWILKPRYFDIPSIPGKTFLVDNKEFQRGILDLKGHWIIRPSLTQSSRNCGKYLYLEKVIERKYPKPDPHAMDSIPTRDYNMIGVNYLPPKTIPVKYWCLTDPKGKVILPWREGHVYQFKRVGDETYFHFYDPEKNSYIWTGADGVQVEME